MSTRGGMVTIEAVDAAHCPVALELPADALVGYSHACREDRTNLLHRLDAARFAECGSYVGSLIAADEVNTQVTLCWYCFPRG